MSKPIKHIGYKAFDKDLKCRGFQYEIGKTFKHTEAMKMCSKGFHFCKRLQDVFKYYSKDNNTRVCEIIAEDIITEGDKSVTSSITILREITKEELDNSGEYNSGYYNSGYYNSGDRNSGDRNSGNYNSGHYNSGYYNSGYYNSGYYNSGDRNSGDRNSGNYNSGHYNSGYYNSGEYNSGHYNSGNRNSGDRNSGNYNSGHYNSGHYNSGYYNSGYYNSGDRNSGDRNSGNYNSGHYNSGHYNSGNRNSGRHNSGDYNSGYFNNTTPKVRLFNKDTELEFNDEKIQKLLCLKVFPILQWVSESQMTKDEKKNNPHYKTTQGYLKHTGRNDYSKLTKENKELIKSLPGFDDAIFKEITGVSLFEEETIEVNINGVAKTISKKKAKELGLIE